MDCIYTRKVQSTVLPSNDHKDNLRMEDRPIFPDPPAVTVERTLAIIKPDAVEYADEIIEEIYSCGFTILQVWCRLLFSRNVVVCPVNYSRINIYSEISGTQGAQ